MNLKILNKVSTVIPFFLLKKYVSAPVILPFYHAIKTESWMGQFSDLYYMPNKRQFEKDLDFFLKYYLPIDLKALTELKKEQRILGSEKYFFLSFDDGLRVCSDEIAAVLERKGIPATFFLNTAFIDNKDLFHRYKASVLVHSLAGGKFNRILFEKLSTIIGVNIRSFYDFKRSMYAIRYPDSQTLDLVAEILGISFADFLKKHKPYMTSEQIQGLIHKGFTIGAHSVDHPEYQLISENDQIEQTLNSINYLSNKFNLDYKVFSFPFTDHGMSSSFFKKLEKETNLDLSFGCAGHKIDLIETNLQRIAMDNCEINARKRIKSELVHFALKVPLGKHITKRDN